MKKLIFKLLSGTLGSIIGHSNLVRIGSFIMRAGRLDIPNSMGKNGEELVQEAIIEYSGNKKIMIIDCGANKGQWTMQLVSTFLTMKSKKYLNIYCFEPSSYTFSQLLETLKHVQVEQIQLTKIQKALSNQQGNIDLKIVHDGAGTNSLVAVPETYNKIEAVEVTTIDAFLKQQNLPYIDFLKIDAEGHDFDVILGAEKLLNHLQISVIQFEYNWRWIYGRHFLQEAFQFFEDRGYSVGKITPKGIQFYSHYDIRLESFIEGNYIACTKNWKKHFANSPGWLE